MWREIDGLFHAGDRILDLGCGTGDDALHLADLGIRGAGIDAAARMVEVARSRGVDASVLAIEDLYRFRQALSRGHFEFRQHSTASPIFILLRHSWRVLFKPRGPVAICLMGRFCLTDWRHAVKRWLGHTQWRGIDVYYPTSRQIRAAFDPWFAFERRVAIGRGDHQLYIFRRRVEC